MMADQLRANGPKPINKGGRPKCWFSDWYEFGHLPKKSAQRMWWEFQYFCDVFKTPAQADRELQLRFSKWWIERNEQDNALKAADPVAYKAAMLARSLELREALKPANKAARKARLQQEALIAACNQWLRANGPKPTGQKERAAEMPPSSNKPTATSAYQPIPTKGTHISSRLTGEQPLTWSKL